MRKHLLETFDDIYILDLHGNSKKKEKAPDGGKDENVFAIQQGVAISIFIRKTDEKKGLGTVHHAELYGKREDKFKALNEIDMQNITWQKLNYSEPYHFFVPKDFVLEEEYEKGFKVDNLFSVSNSGVKTDRDSLFIDKDKSTLEKRIQKLLSRDYNEKFKQEFRVVDSGSYKIIEKVKGRSFDENFIQPIQYRPFDYQWIYYDAEIVSRSGFIAFKHIFQKDNLLFLTSRSIPANQNFDRVLVSNQIADIHSASDQTYVFPLYLYTNDGSRTPNLKKEIVNEIENIVGKICPEDIFDYIYAVLHSPRYRERYKEFLKINFPRVPYPKDAESFKELVGLGTELRLLHLLSSPKVDQFITTYPIAGSDLVEKVVYENGNVFINKDQYFGNLPESAWNFYIGGYQPAQKWLKDRKSRTLTNADIEHYQKMIVALTETERIMAEIDKIASNKNMGNKGLCQGVKIDNSAQITKVRAIFLDSNKEMELTTRENSCCFFFDEIIEYNGIFIQFRLDFNKTLSKDPVLDADFYSGTPICKENKIRNEKVHHTFKDYHEDREEFYYKFKLDGLEINVTFGKDVLKKFEEELKLSDSMTYKKLLPKRKNERKG
ncbi:MAG: type ISP restriction/modification enzyme [Candidatus Desantisbacteria bacterium]